MVNSLRAISDLIRHFYPSFLSVRFVHDHDFRAASIVTCVGSLQAVNFRLASASVNRTSHFFTNLSNKYEIVSLVGTLENSYNDQSEDVVNGLKSYGHIHISLSDEHGNVIGGHLMTGCIVYTTAEITLLEIPHFEHTRTPCPLSGYAELSLRNRQFKSFLGNLQIIFRKIQKQLVHFFDLLYLPFLK